MGIVRRRDEEIAYLQPPANQFGDSPPDIYPAFTHTLKTIYADSSNGSRRYGAIECDPMIQKGLEKTAFNTLGDTKWRVNKSVLDVIDQIWANGGRLADLVDRDDSFG
ncbi:DNA-directed RNA polymerase 1B, mitochondrial-like [Cicer arietinum]|uniref:DNA-directed RNA polymerase 1B, mitochondrial-like n=1 Tax=Cicer arietinum TaxID=3827 RepID=UPI003CC52B8F